MAFSTAETINIVLIFVDYLRRNLPIANAPTTAAMVPIAETDGVSIGSW